MYTVWQVTAYEKVRHITDDDEASESSSKMINDCACDWRLQQRAVTVGAFSSKFIQGSNLHLDMKMIEKRRKNTNVLILQ